MLHWNGAGSSWILEQSRGLISHVIMTQDGQENKRKSCQNGTITFAVEILRRKCAQQRKPDARCDSV